MTELPTTFGKYYLTEKLATGGMAEIYLAKIIGPSGFEKPVVIKQIHPTLSGNRHFVDLFVAEAKTLVTLTHGNIVPVYELGVVDDTYYIAMDYIDGPTLYRLTETMARREATMEPALAAWITGRMLEGLDYAHRKGDGVIHRDLSPRNVMLSRDGEVKLVDFGIAVTLGEPGEGTATETAPTGSFPYMSPEQVRRDQLTPATDLFSVGVLMWEMLTGRRLFHRPDQDSTLAAVLGEDIPRPSSVRPDVPAKLDEVVMRSLERDRDNRWSTAGDMLAAIQKYLYALEVTPGPRDVAALVARFCPPETRRLPTHLEALAHDVISPEPLGSPEAEPDRPAASGPATAVIPRDASAKGKPQRQRSFATNVDLAPLFEGTGQLPAFHDEAEAPETPTKQDRPSALDSTRDTLLDQPAIADRREAPSRGLLVVIGLGGVAMAIAAVWMFYRGRDQVLAESLDAAVPVAVAADAAQVDAAIVEPSAVIDAGVSDANGGARDAGVRRSDASTTSRLDAGRPDAGAAGTATIKVGADPWGEIYVDGKLLGRTPRELTVAAGRHTIEVVFPAETPPRKQTFAVDLAAGETKPIQADFSD